MFQMGRDDEAMDLLRNTFGYMAGTDPASTMWEFIGADGRPEMSYVSMAHAWSAGATSVLTQEVLGVRPLEPGYAKFEVHPHPAGVRHLEGWVPTPHGSIFLKLDSEPDGLLVYMDAPEGLQAEFVLPHGYEELDDPEGVLAPLADERLSIKHFPACFRLTGASSK